MVFSQDMLLNPTIRVGVGLGSFQLLNRPVIVIAMCLFIHVNHLNDEPFSFHNKDQIPNETQSEMKQF